MVKEVVLDHAPGHGLRAGSPSAFQIPMRMRS